MLPRVEELLAEGGIEVDHVTVYRQGRRTSRTSCTETYVKVAGRWTYLYGAIDQHGQVIDVLVSKRRDGAGA